MNREFDPSRRRNFFRLAGAVTASLFLRSSGETVDEEPHFRLPLEGEITRGFWSEHKAIDIMGDIGTPVLAAADGIVSRATSSSLERRVISLDPMEWTDKEGKARTYYKFVYGIREKGYGHYVVIDHHGGFATVYAHLQEFAVKEGDRVFTGEEIGEVGMTGWTTGPHLHFEIRKNGEKVNPVLYLDLNCEA